MNLQFNFFEKLRDPKSAQVLSSIEKFIKNDFNYLQSQKKEDLSQEVQNFVFKTLVEFAKQWNITFSTNNALYAEIIDGIESIVLNSLHSKLFCNTKEEIEEDYKFNRLLRIQSFITPKTLDIESLIIDQTALELSLSKLKEINLFKTPKDKLVTIINFCRILSFMVSSNQSNSPTGADEVFPVIVYAIIKGNINKLKSNVKYINYFRHKSRLESEAEYYFTAISSAIEFIEKLDVSHLNISDSEFKSKIEMLSLKEKVLQQNFSTKKTNIRNNFEDEVLKLVNEGKDVTNNESEGEVIELNSIKNNYQKFKKLQKNSIYKSNDLKGISNLNVDGIFKDYFEKDFSNLTLNQLEFMHDDFMTILKCIHEEKMRQSNLGILNEIEIKINKSEDDNSKTLIDI